VEKRQKTHANSVVTDDDNRARTEVGFEVIEVVEDDPRVLLGGERMPRSEQDHRR